MREHPCNAYLCNGWKCKLNISCLPKHIYINDDYDIYPHNLFYNVLKIGNCKNTLLKEEMEKYLKSNEYIEFIKYNKKVFIKYLANYPYDLMPIIEYIRKEIENDYKS